MKIAALIPARLASVRFPEKLIQDLGGITVLERTYQNVCNTGLFSEVAIVTDSEKIALIAAKAGAKCIRTGHHETGTDRIAEAASHLDADVFINVQGDEPFIDTTALKKLCDWFSAEGEKHADAASLMIQIKSEEEFLNPNVVKVVTDTSGFAMYFSRQPVPHNRDGGALPRAFRHIGVYAFRKAALLRFASFPLTPLEKIEKIEALRLLENGLTIKMIETDFLGVGIDTPEDLEKARKLLK